MPPLAPRARVAAVDYGARRVGLAVTDPLGCELLLPCDVRVPGQLEAAFEQVGAAWGRLDFLLHAIAFAPVEDLHGRVVDCSAAGFAVGNVDCAVVCERPKLAPMRDEMQGRLTEAVGAPVTVKGNRAEGLGAIGRVEGIACFAVAVVTSGDDR